MLDSAIRAMESQGQQRHAKKLWRKRKRLEEYAPHRAVLASTIKVAASAGDASTTTTVVSNDY